MKKHTIIFALFSTLMLWRGFEAIAQNLNVTFRGQLQYPSQTCANICGYVDSLGNEYALVGAAQGMSIVDVTVPTNPVEVMQVPGINNEWKEIKVYGKYAYVTTEGGGGLQIVNLRSLPDVSGIVYHNWTGSGAIAGNLTSIHALHIDGHFAYLYGSTLFGGGAIAVDLTNPWNPTYAGKYQVGSGNSAYVHDGYVRNDTLYAGHIYSGYFSVVDFTNKSAPVELANQFTPNNFTHNTWLSKNSKVLFTTDEVDNSFLTAYDISNLSNITELDRIQSNPGSNSIVHNTHIISVQNNDYAVTSWYKDGFTIVDVGRPQNLVQVGNYDTFTAGSGGGFDGDWGVYPFLPSGNIVVSNINEGLFVFTPTYVRACYLEGVVTDSACGVQLNNAHITITAVNINEPTDLTGQYRTGTPQAGTYSVVVSKPGYTSKTISGVVLTHGIVTNLNVALVPFNTIAVNGLTTDSVTSTAISGVKVNISDTVNSYNFVSNGSGTFTSCNVLSATDYSVYAGKWGYKTYCASSQTINQSNNSPIYPLNLGYYDDFALDFGWTVSGDATTGAWERGIPLGTDFNGTPANPGVDVTTDCSNMAYVTGNNAINASDDDVDNGSTTLKSPLFDLTGYINPYLEYSRWFFNSGGSGSPNDSLSIFLSNGSTTHLMEFVLATTTGNSTWVHKSFKISDFIAPTATMRVIVRTADNAPGHIVEAGFDKFLITGSPNGIGDEFKVQSSKFQVYPNPFSEQTTIDYKLQTKLVAGASITITDVTGRIVNTLSITQASGTILLNTSLRAGIYFVRINNGTEITAPVKVLKM